jgi:N-acetylglutamate synthase-like GNAT family acetyltransferase
MRVNVNQGEIGARQFDIRQAARADEEDVRSLLRSCDLPDEDIRHHLPHFVVASREGGVVGTVGLEVFGSSALLRSLAVALPSRGAGLATRLVAAIAERAHQLGVRELWLLTTTAEAFFAKLGFRTVSRAEAPLEIQSTREFRALCPASAVLMRHRIDSIWSRPEPGHGTIHRRPNHASTGHENGG